MIQRPIAPPEFHLRIGRKKNSILEAVSLANLRSRVAIPNMKAVTIGRSIQVTNVGKMPAVKDMGNMDATEVALSRSSQKVIVAIPT